jgi:mono/diheme cytochrome c family protein
MKEDILISRFFNWKRLMMIIVLMLFILFFLNAYAQSPPWVAPKIADNVKSPLSGNAASLAEGRTLYVANCGPCHGEKGRGDGPASQGLNPKPADHTSVAVQSQTDGAIFWKLSEGRAPMPGYKKIFSEQQRWGLINYIRTLAKGKKK